MLKIGFGNQCLLALGAGAVFGLSAPLHLVDALSPLGDAFLQLLKMVIVPLTFVFIVTSFTRLENVGNIKKLGGKTFFWFLTTALIAATVGVSVGVWINPGAAFHQALPVSELKNVPAFSQIFLEMIPGNLIDQIARGKIIPVIIFAVLFAIALTLAGDEAIIVQRFFAGMAHVMFKITRWIIRLSPIGIFVFIATACAHNGMASLVPFAKFILALYLACFIQLIIYGLLISTLGRVHPLHFVKAAWPMLLTAFTTSSSLATLPVTLDTLIKRLHIPEQIASFVAPLGANAKMDGCGAIYPALICIFTASLLQVSLDWHQYCLIIVTAAIATIGTAGVPGSAAVMAMVVLSSIGLPFSGLALVLGIDKILDMMRTLVNVTGTAVCAILVSASHQQPELVAQTEQG